MMLFSWEKDNNTIYLLLQIGLEQSYSTKLSGKLARKEGSERVML
jgi:hypothetical protein